MLRVAALMATAYAVKTLKLPADVNQLRTADSDSSELKNCTYTQIYEIQTDVQGLQNCIENKGCGGAQQNENDGDNRRRLQDDEQSSFDMYACYCNKCSKYLTRLQSACNACDAPNYQDPCAEGQEDNGNCQEGMEQFLYEESCIQAGYMVVAHQDTFCDMMKSSKTCLKEMEYMMNPPQEEEEDDNNNNNGRRRLADQEEEGQVAVEDIIACWASALTGGETYGSLTACHQTCFMYGNNTYDYIYDGQEEPVQTCGIAIQEIDLASETTDLLPSAVQHAGVACVSSSCSAEDAESIMTYVNLMSAYSSFIQFNMDEEGNNNNNKNDEGMNYNVEVGIPSTRVSWKCTGDADEGVIATEDFPEDEVESCEEQEENEEGGGSSGSGSEAKWATAATFAIVFALGMGVFACLYVHYYRQLMKLRKAGQGQPLVNNQAPAQANVGYQGVTA